MDQHFDHRYLIGIGMNRWLHNYFDTQKSISFRIFIHFLFWILVLGLNWFFTYGSFPQTSGSEKYYYLLNYGLIIGFTYGITALFNSKRHWGWIFPLLSVGVVFCMYVDYYAITFLDQLYPEETGFMHRYKTIFGDLRADEIWKSREVLGVAANTTGYLLYLSLLLKLSYEVIKKNHRERKLKEENMKLELDFLRARVSPHFLFNSLHNIYSQMGEDDPATTSLQKLADLLRYTLYESGKESVSLVKELNFIKDYIGLEKLRLPSHKQIRMEIDAAEDSRTIKPFILLAFVENAIKHGIHNTNKEAWADIRISLCGDTLHLSCSNSAFHTPLMKGLGLDNTLRRLEHYYPNRYEYTPSFKDGVYTVQLRLRI